MAKQSSAAKQTSVDLSSQLLRSVLTDIVIEMVQTKCQTLNPRERSTLERRIGRAIALFVEGQGLSAKQKQVQAKRDAAKGKGR